MIFQPPPMLFVRYTCGGLFGEVLLCAELTEGAVFEALAREREVCSRVAVYKIVGAGETPELWAVEQGEGSRVWDKPFPLEIAAAFYGHSQGPQSNPTALVWDTRDKTAKSKPSARYLLDRIVRPAVTSVGVKVQAWRQDWTSLTDENKQHACIITFLDPETKLPDDAKGATMKVQDFIELCEDKKKGTYWYRIVNQNGQVELTSETYTRKATRTILATRFGQRTGIPFRSDGKKPSGG